MSKELLLFSDISFHFVSHLTAQECNFKSVSKLRKMQWEFLYDIKVIMGQPDTSGIFNYEENVSPYSTKLKNIFVISKYK